MSGEEAKRKRLVSFADIAARQEAEREGAPSQRGTQPAPPERVTYADLAALSRKPEDFKGVADPPILSTPVSEPHTGGIPETDTPKKNRSIRGIPLVGTLAAPPVTDRGIPEGTTSVCHVLIPRRQIRAALTARDGHSLGEQAVYETLWTHAGPHTAESRIVSAGYRTLSALCRLTVNNCKANLQSLGRKLAIEEAGSHTYTQGKTYIVYSEAAILARRQAAGLTHYVRSRGITFVDPATGKEIGATPEAGTPEGDKTDEEAGV